MNKKTYRKTNARLRAVIERGLSVACLRCSAKEQVKVALYHGGKARCSSCGGPVERVRAPGGDVPPTLDARRVVPRKPGCEVRQSGM